MGSRGLTGSHGPTGAPESGGPVIRPLPVSWGRALLAGAERTSVHLIGGLPVTLAVGLAVSASASAGVLGRNADVLGRAMLGPLLAAWLSVLHRARIHREFARDPRAAAKARVNAGHSPTVGTAAARELLRRDPLWGLPIGLASLGSAGLLLSTTDLFVPMTDADEQGDAEHAKDLSDDSPR